jgi:hypothetical protein
MSKRTNQNWKHPICRVVDRKRRTHLLLPLLVVLLAGFSANVMTDRFEDNDTLATATSLGVVPGIHLNDVDVNESNDQDWYKVELLRDDAIDVAIFFVHSQGDLALVVTDDGGSELGSSDSSTDNETVSLSGLTAGTHYIRVYSLSGAINDYDLAVELGVSSLTRVLYVNDSNTTNDVYTLANGNESNDGLSPLASQVAVFLFIRRQVL